MCVGSVTLQLKANVLGTEFLLRGKGGDPGLHKGFNAQLLAVNFKPTINQVKAGPRTMTACVPVPEAMQVRTNLQLHGVHTTAAAAAAHASCM
jgi:hypothetical protein